MKKLVSIFLSLILIFCSLGINDTSFAESTYKNFNYVVINSNVVITEYFGDEKNVVIPSEIYGKKVTTIGEYAFFDNRNLENIQIPNSVTSIEDGAFYSCEKLEKIEIPNDVTFIGDQAFSECEKLRYAKLPKNLKGIKKHLFCNCEVLDNIEIPDSVTFIDEFAFLDCTNLKYIKIPNNVTEINSCAFDSCENLMRVDIPDTDIFIESGAFARCENLTIYGSLGSNAEEYADKNDIDFISTGISLSSSDIKVNSIANQPYTGSKIEPNVVVKYKNKVLIKDVDYKLVYTNNTSVGTATIKITGLGKYTGTKTLTFKIVPKTVTGIKQTEQTTSKIGLTWNKASRANGYYVYRSTDKEKNYKKIYTLPKYSENYYTDYDLSNGTVYYYKIRSYRKENSKTYYGNYSDVYTASTKCSRPSITVTSPKTRNIKVSWKKVNGADGYEVHRATSKNGTYSLKKTITKGSTLSYTNTGLTKGKTYYYKVRAYKIVDGEKVYSDYSLIKYVKCK